jgi:hypothetical protein
VLATTFDHRAENAPGNLGRALCLLIEWGKQARAEQQEMTQPDAKVSEADASGRASDDPAL